MKSSAKNIRLTPVDDLFSTEESRADTQRERVVELPLTELHPFRNHPFKVSLKSCALKRSTRISGILAHHGAGDGEVVATITTDTNGVAESPLLTYGTYRIDETVAPSGYVNSAYSKEVSISEDNLQTVEVVVENESMTGGLRLTKTNSMTGAPIEGVKFNIFQGDPLIVTMTTDKNGIATCDNLNRGTYIVKEDSLPEGYTGELVVLEAVVQPDGYTDKVSCCKGCRKYGLVNVLVNFLCCTLINLEEKNVGDLLTKQVAFMMHSILSTEFVPSLNKWIYRLTDPAIRR